MRIDPDGTTEVSPTPPPVEMQRVIALREMYGERKVVRRIHPGSLPSQQQLEYEKKKHLEEQRLQLLLMKSRSKIVEERCATKLQAHWRKHKATRLALLQRIKAAAATRLQRRFRFFNYSRKDIYALRLLSFIRMTITRSQFQSFVRERLWWNRAKRNLASNVQRLWRGFKGRSQYRRGT